MIILIFKSCTYCKVLEMPIINFILITWQFQMRFWVNLVALKDFNQSFGFNWVRKKGLSIAKKKIPVWITRFFSRIPKFSGCQWNHYLHFFQPILLLPHCFPHWRRFIMCKILTIIRQLKFEFILQDWYHILQCFYFQQRPG